MMIKITCSTRYIESGLASARYVYVPSFKLLSSCLSINTTRVAPSNPPPKRIAADQLTYWPASIFFNPLWLDNTCRAQWIACARELRVWCSATTNKRRQLRALLLLVDNRRSLVEAHFQESATAFNAHQAISAKKLSHEASASLVPTEETLPVPMMPCR